MSDDITFSKEEELAAYRAMLLIRRFEEKAGQLYALGAIRGACPLSIGQEAAIAGVLMAARASDPVIASPRCHGHMLLRGVAPEAIFAELLGRESGIAKGRGGSGHMMSPAHGFFGGHVLAGAAASIATGLAFAGRYRNHDDVALAFFGTDAALGGRVAESYRLAHQSKLPIVFIIENNRASAAQGEQPGETGPALAQFGHSFGVPGEQVDGIDVRRARSGARAAIARARAGAGPQILEMLTFRYQGHGGLPARPGSAEKRRDDADPIAKARARMLASGEATEAELKLIEKEAREIINAAAAAAKAAPSPILGAAAATSGTSQEAGVLI